MRNNFPSTVTFMIVILHSICTEAANVSYSVPIGKSIYISPSITATWWMERIGEGRHLLDLDNHVQVDKYGHLKIERFDKAHEGAYWMHIYDKDKDMTPVQDYMAAALFANGTKKWEPQQVHFTTGDDVFLTCPFTTRHNEIMWYREDYKKIRTSKIKGKQLVITDSIEDDSGTYFCSEGTVGTWFYVSIQEPIRTTHSYLSNTSITSPEARNCCLAIEDESVTICNCKEGATYAFIVLFIVACLGIIILVLLGARKCRKRNATDREHRPVTEPEPETTMELMPKSQKTEGNIKALEDYDKLQNQLTEILEKDGDMERQLKDITEKYNTLKKSNMEIEEKRIDTIRDYEWKIKLKETRIQQMQQQLTATRLFHDVEIKNLQDQTAVEIEKQVILKDKEIMELQQKKAVALQEQVILKDKEIMQLQQTKVDEIMKLKNSHSSELFEMRKKCSDEIDEIHKSIHNQLEDERRKHADELAQVVAKYSEWIRRAPQHPFYPQYDMRRYGSDSALDSLQGGTGPMGLIKESPSEHEASDNGDQ